MEMKLKGLKKVEGQKFLNYQKHCWKLRRVEISSIPLCIFPNRKNVSECSHEEALFFFVILFVSSSIFPILILHKHISQKHSISPFILLIFTSIDVDREDAVEPV